MPKLKMSWPNRITVARIMLIVPFVIAMLHLNDPQYSPWSRYGALAIFLLMAFSDALDGFLARRLNSATPLGSFLDPLADKLLIICTCLLLSAGPTAVSGMELPSAVVVIIIGKDLFTVLGFVIIYLVTSEVTISPAKTGKLSTDLQLAMVIAILISPDVMRVFGGFKYVVHLLWWAAAAVAVATTIVYTRLGSRILNEYEQRQKQKKNLKNNPPTERKPIDS
ncbi:MAG: hypothetical protein AMJ79_08675 [Phycisphaerae bacterium SM23_30]|nr:MAG: hypothetical protein AMJ79_08675 [Phycisphaerae bacterium SM23_30]